MKVTSIFSIVSVCVNAAIIYFFFSPEISAIVFTIVPSAILGYFLSHIYKGKSWLMPSAFSIAFPILGFLLLGFWWKSAFSWDVSYRPPIYLTILLFLGWTMIFTTPYFLLLSLINGIRSLLRNTAEQGGDGDAEKAV